MKKRRFKWIAIILCLMMIGSLAPQPVLAAPSVPTGLTVSAVDDNQISLSWNYAGDASYYYIYRATSLNGTYKLIGSVTYAGYLDKTVSRDTVYYYKVRAYDSRGMSSRDSEAASASVSGSAFDITASAIGSNQIYLSWNSPGSASSYTISRSLSYYGSYSNIATAYASDYTDRYLTPGTTYYYRVEGVDSWGSTIYYSSVVSATVDSSGDDSSSIETERLAGANRYETAKAIAQAGWDYSYHAVIASGENYPDALCSAPLAAKYDAPILLTGRDSLDAYTRNELVRLNTKSVFLAGGTGVISAGTEQAIRNMGISVTRLAGIDRYDTSLQIARHIGGSTEAVIATGQDYPDALSIAPIAAMKKMPVILTPKNSLTEDLKQYIRANFTKTYVVGGEQAVSTAVLNQLPSPVRLSGANRYQTNIEIIRKFTSELNLTTVYLATGQSFPDALAGAVLAGRAGSPVVLVSSPLDRSTADFISARRNTMTAVKAFGGYGVIPGNLLSSITNSRSGSSLAAPTGLTVVNSGSNQVYLSWDSVGPANHYSVYRSTEDDGYYHFVTTVSSPWYTDKDLASDTTYYYRITAGNSSSTSPYSSTVSVTTNYNYRYVPTGLTAEARGQDQIYLSWSPTYSADYYNIYRSTSESGPFTYVAGVSTTSYLNTGLKANTTYYYKISAYSSTSGDSPYSSVAEAKTEGDGTGTGTAPAAPATLTASADGANKINLSWSAVSGAVSYSIFSSASANGTYANVDTVSAPATSYAHTGLTAGRTYFYKVQAKNSAGVVGGYSAVASATTGTSTPAVPGVPQGLTATAGDGEPQITLSWSAVGGASSYTISRSVDDITYTEIAANVATNSYTDTDTDLAANTAYYYKVSARNTTGTSDRSAAAQAVTAPETPNGLVANADPGNPTSRIVLSWNAVDGAVSYNVYRSSMQDGAYAYLGNISGTAYIDVGLTAGTTYYYRVCAVNNAGTQSRLSAPAAGSTSPTAGP